MCHWFSPMVFHLMSGFVVSIFVAQALGDCVPGSGVDGTCDDRDRPALKTETLLLQTSSRRGPDAMAEGSLPTTQPSSVAPTSPQPPTDGPAGNLSACWSLCNVNGGIHSCRARAFWMWGAHETNTLAEALEVANKQCEGQCVCTMEDMQEMELPCRIAEEGEYCYQAVEWARTHGIRLQPEVYDGLNSGSTFAQFQNWLFMHGYGHCRRPCGVCHIAQPGDSCYEAVLLAMQEGEREEFASFEQAQASLSRAHNESFCPMPCNLCYTAKPGDQCHKGVTWAMQHGIHYRPDWYSGLTPESSFEEFQVVLHNMNHERCPLPCMENTTNTMELALVPRTTDVPSTSVGEMASSSASPLTTF